MKKNLFIVGILLFAISGAFSEQNDAKKVKYTVAHASKETEKLIEFNKSLKKYGYESLNILKEYFNDPSETNRIGVYSRLKDIANENNPEIKREIIELLVEQLKDSKNIRVLYKILSRYPLYFSDKAKKQLTEYLEKAIANNDSSVKYLIELAGIANVVEAKPILEKYLEVECEKERKNAEEKERMYAEDLKRYKKTPTEIQRKVYETDKWFSKLTSSAWTPQMVLARMGEKKYIDECIDIMSKSYSRKDEEFRNMTKLEYIRQPETINVLIEYLNGDLDDGHNPKTTYGQSATYYLSECLDSFPIKKQFNDIGRYTLNDVEITRKWVKENYSPKLIKSLSVLIDGKIVNNLEAIQTASVKEKVKTQTETKAPEIKENRTSLYVICAIILILISGFVAFSVLKKKK